MVAPTYQELAAEQVLGFGLQRCHRDLVGVRRNYAHIARMMTIV